MARFITQPWPIIKGASHADNVTNLKSLGIYDLNFDGAWFAANGIKLEDGNPFTYSVSETEYSRLRRVHTSFKSDIDVYVTGTIEETTAALQAFRTWGQDLYRMFPNVKVTATANAVTITGLPNGVVLQVQRRTADTPRGIVQGYDLDVCKWTYTGNDIM